MQPLQDSPQKNDRRASLTAAAAIATGRKVAQLKEYVLSRFNQLEARVDEALNRQMTPGPAGKNGHNGLDGLDGKHGKDGLNGKDGAQGERGLAGKDGKPGLAGKDGRDGLDGKQGERGPDGRNGLDGKDGERGERGLRGFRGIKGADGHIPDHRWVGPELQFEKPDGTWGKRVNLQGPPGHNGVSGGRSSSAVSESRVLELIEENSSVTGTEQKTYHQRFTTAGTHTLNAPLTAGKKLRFRYFNLVGSPDNTATENVTLQWAGPDVIHSQDVSQYGQPHATSLGQNYVTGDTNELPEVVLTVGQTVDVNIRYEEVD